MLALQAVFLTLSFGGSRCTEVGRKLGFLSLGSLCCEHQVCPQLPMRATPPPQFLIHQNSDMSSFSSSLTKEAFLKRDFNHDKKLKASV